MRRIVEVDSHGTRLLGTYHHPRATSSQLQAPSSGPASAFVLLNAGFLPREGPAGWIVELADRLAFSGHPAFRFDLPGLGDSPGVVPASIDSFYRMLHNGMHVASVLNVMSALRQTYGFQSFVLGGLCGAAVTSLLAAAHAPKDVAGIVAFELELFFPLPEPMLIQRQALWSRERWLRLLTGHGRLGGKAALAGALLPTAMGRALLPPHANFVLIEALEDYLERNKPMLLMMSADSRRQQIYDQVRRVLFARTADSNVRWRSVPGTNPTFTTDKARRQVVDEVAIWSDLTFAPCARDPVAVVEPTVAKVSPASSRADSRAGAAR